MLKHFTTGLAWVFWFLFLLFIEKHIPIYVYARMNIPYYIISWAPWGGLFLCGLSVSWCMDFSAWWLCFAYAIIISIVIFMYNSLVNYFFQPTDFPGVVGSIWLSIIFFILTFFIIFIGFSFSYVLKFLLSK
ncbi:hypothetical protein [Trabulsiella odontotermitis]|uniref:hypothetical protein n=1 Tax=Trabulsiella odontotermitis TaxID=379893 RepID=UPI000A9B1043|nr:hypothetical protein [Trabulsiella odontotermitis]